MFQIIRVLKRKEFLKFLFLPGFQTLVFTNHLNICIWKQFVSCSMKQVPDIPVVPNPRRPSVPNLTFLWRLAFLMVKVQGNQRFQLLRGPTGIVFQMWRFLHITSKVPNRCSCTSIPDDKGSRKPEDLVPEYYKTTMVLQWQISKKHEDTVPWIFQHGQSSLRWQAL